MTVFNIETATRGPRNGLSTGASGLSYYSGVHVLIDRKKESAGWTVETAADWWGWVGQTLRAAGGYLDADGWPSVLPADALNNWRMAFYVYPDCAGKTYEVTWEGTGTVTVSGNYVTNIQQMGLQGDGRYLMTFDVTNPTKGESTRLQVDTNPAPNNVKNLTIIRTDHKALYEAGEIFSPEYLAALAGLTVVRFMDPPGTNSSTLATWADRPTPSDISYDERTVDNSIIGKAGKGMPLENMVAAANRLGVDPWFNIPHGADDAFITNFATYVRDNLNTGLLPQYELSNEVWNASFSVQYSYFMTDLPTLWGWDTVGDGAARQSAYGKRFVGMVALIDAVYGGDTSRRKCYLGTHTASDWVTEQTLEAPVWASNEPGDFVAPHTVCDGVAVTTYFGSDLVYRRPEGTIDAMMAAPDPNVWLRDYLLDPANTRGVPAIQVMLEAQSAYLETLPGNIPLIGYEGGTHTIHDPGGLDSNGVECEFTTEELAVLYDFQRSDEFYQVMVASGESWRSVSDTPYMQFHWISPASKSGWWGPLENINSVMPRWGEYLQQY